LIGLLINGLLAIIKLAAGVLGRSTALVADAVDRGAGLACGGRRPPGFERGFFYEPTVLSDVALSFLPALRRL